jgi:hypothetical protein
MFVLFIAQDHRQTPIIKFMYHFQQFVCLFICLMFYSATFNNITDISCRSVLFVEETGGPGENHQPVASH